MTEQLRKEMAAPLEDLCSILSTLMEVHNHL